MCRGFGDRCFELVVAHEMQLFEDQTRLQMEKHLPLADWYISKVLNRVDRTLAGEHLGDLVESDLEDLEIDDDFEL